MAAIRHPLTYRFPDSLPVSPGQRVLVPLATRKAMGIVLRPTSGWRLESRCARRCVRSILNLSSLRNS